ncbi:MAG: GNAT family N-acetyltransferase [Ktedonobacteraceae bacterium]
MVSTDRALLRLHVEAVWGVQLPPLAQNEHVLAPASFRPAWKLYAADLAHDRVHIWRPDVDATERKALRLQVNEALAFPPVVAPIAGISREVALSLATSPRINVDAVRNIARPLTAQDRPLVEIFQPASADDYFHPAKRPLIGVVIAGRLLSVAHSSRRTGEACELGIDTLPEARRKGYALAATILWAHAVMQEGLVPLYSALADNTASLHLAAAAGYRVFARGATFAG